MSGFFMFLSVCLSTTYVIKADNGAFNNGYQQPYNGWNNNYYWGYPQPFNRWNNNYWGNFQSLWALPKPYYQPQNNGFYSNSNYNGFNNYNNANQGVSVEVQNGVLLINGKQVTGFEENQGAVIKYGEGILTVNGERKTEFDGISGTGTINIGPNSITSSVNNVGNNSDINYNYGENSWTDQSFTTPENYNMGNQDLNVNTNQYGNTYNDQQCPGCTLGSMFGRVLTNEDISMGIDGIKIGGPNGIQMGFDGIKIGSPHGLKIGNQGFPIGNRNQWFY